MSEQTLRVAVSRLIEYASTCQMENTADWIDGFATRLNETIVALGNNNELVEVVGDGMILTESDPQE